MMKLPPCFGRQQFVCFTFEHKRTSNREVFPCGNDNNRFFIDLLCWKLIGLEWNNWTLWPVRDGFVNIYARNICTSRVWRCLKRGRRTSHLFDAMEVREDTQYFCTTLCGNVWSTTAWPFKSESVQDGAQYSDAVTCNPFGDQLLPVCRWALCLVLTILPSCLPRFTSLHGDSSHVSVYSCRVQVSKPSPVRDPSVQQCQHNCHIPRSPVAVPLPPEACAALPKHVLIYEPAKMEEDSGSISGSCGTFSEPSHDTEKKPTRLESSACQLEPSFDTVYLYEWKVHVVSVLIRNLRTLFTST